MKTKPEIMSILNFQEFWKFWLENYVQNQAQLAEVSVTENLSGFETSNKIV